MAKPRSLEAKLTRLRALRHETASPGYLAELRQALADRSSLVVAEAAKIAGDRLLSDMGPDLVSAFHRFMIEPVETDKLCTAKLAIVEALDKIESDNEAVFLKAIGHVQKEPCWGGTEDTAGHLRGAGAFGLVRLGHRDVDLLLADLLVDPEKVARIAAAKALGALASRAAIPLLRFKARIGDEETEVTTECLTALMSAAPEESLAFVARFLDSANEAIQEGAAFALGESRRPEALEILLKRWPAVQLGDPAEVHLLAISMTRLPAALDFLVEVLAADDRRCAEAALSALAIHGRNERLKERIAAVVAGKGDASLRDSFEKKFGAKA